MCTQLPRPSHSSSRWNTGNGTHYRLLAWLHGLCRCQTSLNIVDLDPCSNTDLVRASQGDHVFELLGWVGPCACPSVNTFVFKESFLSPYMELDMWTCTYLPVNGTNKTASWTVQTQPRCHLLGHGTSTRRQLQTARSTRLRTMQSILTALKLNITSFFAPCHLSRYCVTNSNRSKHKTQCLHPQRSMQVTWCMLH